MSYARALRSSDTRALSDDARKDDENAAFIAGLPLSQQAEWLARLRWLRLADRLAENEMLEPSDGRFTAFRRGWKALLEHGDVSDEHAAIWGEMRATWWAPSGDLREPLAVASFGAYLDALGEYTQPGLVIRTLADHDRMLLRITGSGVCVFPYLRGEDHDAAAGFGMLDQMMNNLRDLAEDASNGLCFLPRDVLARFSVPVEAMLDGSAVKSRGYLSLMRFWVDEHLAAVRRCAAPFLSLRDLHPSLQAMRESSVARYARIRARASGVRLRLRRLLGRVLARPGGSSARRLTSTRPPAPALSTRGRC